MARLGAIEHAKKLWILQHVVETGSLRKAALRARITPSAVSQAITTLEKLVGKPLLVRGGDGIVPTERALEIIREASVALQVLSSFSTLSEEEAAPPISWISFGTYESLAIELLPQLSSRMQEKIPGIKLTLRVARTAALASMVRKGELCAALVSESDCFGGLNCVDIAEDRLGFYAHRKLKPMPLTVDELRKALIGGLAPGSDGLPSYYRKFLDSILGESFKPMILSDSFEALRATALGGQAICVLPAGLVARQPDELLEVLPSEGSVRTQGRHRLLLITQESCDPAEVRFLEKELRFLLSKRESGFTRP